MYNFYSIKQLYHVYIFNIYITILFVLRMQILLCLFYYFKGQVRDSTVASIIRLKKWFGHELLFFIIKKILIILIIVRFNNYYFKNIFYISYFIFHIVLNIFLYFVFNTLSFINIKILYRRFLIMIIMKTLFIVVTFCCSILFSICEN
jgi:hypothetical protein